jgi:hypothetical protein
MTSAGHGVPQARPSGAVEGNLFFVKLWQPDAASAEEATPSAVREAPHFVQLKKAQRLACGDIVN